MTLTTLVLKWPTGVEALLKRLEQQFSYSDAVKSLDPTMSA